VFTKTEIKIMDKFIHDPTLRSSLSLIKEALMDIWDPGVPRIIKDFTDHGVKHSERLVSYLDKLLEAHKGHKLSEREMYLLLAGIYLHDIGMQCDVVTYPIIKTIAEKLNAEFKCKFKAKASNDLSLEEQKEIRKNHHYLSAAWIKYAYDKNDTSIGNAIRTVPWELVSDLMDICMYHSQLPITNCSINSSIISNGRKRFLAALLRFSDELDIGNDHVNVKAIQDFSLDPKNSVYWWLHGKAKVSFPAKNLLLIQLVLHPDDKEKHGTALMRIFIEGFKTKNRQVLDELWGEGIPISYHHNSGITPDQFSQKLPEYIIKEILEIKVNPIYPIEELIRKDLIEEFYVDSIYGSRSSHFRAEKIILAGEAVNRLDSYLTDPEKSDLKFCIFIDSGTTTYHIFRQICRKIEDKNKRKMWTDRVFLITNNLLGLLYLMKYCKEDPANERSEIALKCFFLPGKPLTPYIAVASDETVEWLSKNVKFFLEKEWELEEAKYFTISFIGASYFVRQKGDNDNDNWGYYPVAREEGHVKIKKELVNLSDEVFIVAPLMKFSFAGVNMLNGVNGFNIDYESFDAYNDERSKLKYVDIPIERRKSVLFTTRRGNECIFSEFSRVLLDELKMLYVTKEFNNLIVVPFDVKKHKDPKVHSESEINVEIPHEKLRISYREKKINIWDKSWVQAHEKDYE
jgi:hypothetical protein